MKGKILDLAMRHIPLVATLKTYTMEYLRRDIVAALTVAVVAIPQSMAYAIIAGVNPVYGLYTAIVSTIPGAVFGSSNHLIAGPTNAISLLIASGMARYMGLSNAYELLFLMTFTVGAMQIFLGVIKLGKTVNYVSHAVIVGFTAGAGILIALGQLNQLLGISIVNASRMPTMRKILYVFTHFDTMNSWALAMGALTMAIILLCKRIDKKLPGSLIGIMIPIAFIIGLSLEAKGVKLTGNIPTALPPFVMVKFSYEGFRQIFSGALAIAIIGLVEAISIAKSIAATSRQKIDANQEFIGQGIANLGGSFFQCFAGSGSFTRSAINYQSGAATRVAGILSGVLVALVLVFLASFARYIPMPSLAGVIIIIGYGMVNRKEMMKITRAEKSDAIAMWGTMGATVLMPDLDFSSASDLEAKLDSLADRASVFILRLKQVISIDVTSMEIVRDFIHHVRASGSEVVISGLRGGLNSMLARSDMLVEVSEENRFLSEDEVFASSTKALARARELLAGELQAR